MKTFAFIESDLKWREGELSTAKLALVESLRQNSSFPFFVRSFVAITYAHCEGYVKAITREALSEMYSSISGVSDLRFDIVGRLCGPNLRKSLCSESNATLASLVLSGNFSLSKSHLPRPEDVVETSNLTFDCFVEVAALIGIEGTTFSSYKTILNHVVNVRNKCAHGEFLIYDRSISNREIAEYWVEKHHRVMTFLFEYGVCVIDHLDRKAFFQDGTISI